ncbi:MAG TPA: TetR/AcrR family transcriptional regulator [Solirubrobacterales bacterium]|nr:TetR/AcrR family transcriptional regulator [Solirubrobacterales bacterium]
MAEVPPALTSEPASGRRISREIQAEERRRQLLDRMTKVFAKRGYRAATVTDLLAGAKIGMGAFYEEFEGKEDCFVAVYDRVLERAEAQLAAAMTEGGADDWTAQVSAGLAAVIRFVAEDPLAAKVVLLEAQTGGPAALERHRKVVAEVASFLARGRDEGAPGKRLPEDFEESTASGLLWLLQTKVARGEIGDPDELHREMLKVVLEPFLGPARTKRAIENTR